MITARVVRACTAAALLATGGCVAAPRAAPPIPASRAQPVLLDDFEALHQWRAIPAEGVRLELHADRGLVGQALRLDVDVSRGGYAIARRELDLPLPENYEIAFWIRGDLPPNTLEFKLVDGTGENVWWHVQRDRAWPAEWQRVRIRKRQISFAWGPRGGGELDRVAALEIAITAGAGGGRGSIWLDSLSITPLEPVRPYDLTPRVIVSDGAPGFSAAGVLDPHEPAGWESTVAATRWLALDFLRMREFGGVTVSWDSARRPADYDVQVSSDGAAWETVHQVRGGAGARDFVPLPDTEARWLRLHVGPVPPAIALRGVQVHPLEWSATRNDFLRAVAAEGARGSWPRYLYDEQLYWTVVGAPHGRAEALVSEDGALEPRRAGPMLEPFLHTGERLVGWSDVQRDQYLELGSLPIPTVRWSVGELRLSVTAVADTGGAASLHARYRVHNDGAAERSAVLFLAVRPVQVNPSWQFLGTTGGAARVESLAIDDGLISVNGEPFAQLWRAPAHRGALPFHAGNIVDHLRARALPAARDARDVLGYASGAVGYDLRLAPGGFADVYVTLPMSGDAAVLPHGTAAEQFESRIDDAVARWQRETGAVHLTLPADGAPLAQAVRSTLAYILINRDGAAIQPGTRAYRRSWIRDGSLTSAALLRLGRADVVRAYIDWFAPFQYENGKVPCCVDHRGADPVPEHDSHGQLIWLIAEYFRFTGDTALVRRHWPRVQLAIAHMDSLRRSRMTRPYVDGDSTAFFGLLPQSISHEGYSEKPMHSFWDDLFGLRGYKDAAWLAGVLGDEGTRRAYAAERDRFRQDIVRAYEATMRRHGIDWLAGAVELGDFDATSTTVAVSPVDEAHHLPQRALHRTFDKYLENFRARRDGREPWEAYTPYEWRAVGTLVRLGRPAAAHEVANWFMGHRRPEGWNHWAEVVWREPRAPRVIGDMPHGWVGSDFVRSVLDMLAFEREADSTLVVGAAVPLRWVRTPPGVQVLGLHTAWGVLDLRAAAAGQQDVELHVGGTLRVPRAGVVVNAPMDCTVRRARVNGRQANVVNGTVTVRRLPATVLFSCAPHPPQAVR